MNSIDKIYPEGWLLFCPECSSFLKQSDPQNNSQRKSVVIDDEPCEKCKAAHAQEVQEAQDIMGRLGLPKETQ